MRNEKGMTLIELVIVMSLATVALVAAASYALPWIARERGRSAVYDVQSYLQLARIEAVSRNRDCRFVLDTSTKTLQVYDDNGTPATKTDDILLYDETLPADVQFARPDTGAPVTLAQVGTSSVYETVFDSDGTVSTGSGEVALFSGNEYNRVVVFGAGGVSVDRWHGTGWVDDATSAGTAQSTTGNGSTLPPVDGGSTGTGGTGDGYLYQTY